MFVVQLKGFDELQARLKFLSARGLAAAQATVMTRTAVSVRNELQTTAHAAFDKPTPYTIKQLRYVAATAEKPSAVVGFNVAAIQDVFGTVIRYENLAPGSTPAGKYLQFQTEGGQRREKRFERALRAVNVLPAGWLAVPGERAKLDAYGNHSPGEIRQILSWFDAAELVAGSRQNMYDKGRQKRMKGTKKTAGFEYFAVRLGDRRSFVRSGGSVGSKAMQPGIYRRTFTGFGDRIEPIVIFVRRAAYKKRWDFYGIAERHAMQIMPNEMRRVIQEKLDARA